MMKEDKPELQSKEDMEKNKLMAKRNYLKEILYFFINFYNPVDGEVYLARHGCLIEDFRD